MDHQRRNPSPSPSISSIASDARENEHVEEADVINFVKKRLMKRLFLGHYEERRYVDSLRAYRDLVILDKSETELQFDFERVYSRLLSHFGRSHWLGITGPHSIEVPAYCLCTKLQDVAFGYYWFQIRQIRFEDQEVSVKLKVIRAVDFNVIAPTVNSTSFTQSLAENLDSLKTCIQTSIHSLKQSQSTSQESGQRINIQPKDSDEKNSSISSEDASVRKQKESTDTSVEPNRESGIEPLKMQDLWLILHYILCNSKAITSSVVGAFVATIHAFVKCVEYIGNFSLKLLHEMTLLLKTMTPVILAVIELVGKLIGGFYILLAMIFQRRGMPEPRAPVLPKIENSTSVPSILYNTSPRGTNTGYNREGHVGYGGRPQPVVARPRPRFF